MSAAAAFHDELASARIAAEERRRVLAEAPELSAEQILAGFAPELRSISVDGFGKVYYISPIGVADYFEFLSKLDDKGEATATQMVGAIISFARNSDGSKKFAPEHAPILMKAPPAAVATLVNAITGNRVSLVSAEKK